LQEILQDEKKFADKGQSCADLPLSSGFGSEDFCLTNALVSPKLRKSSNKVIFSMRTNTSGVGRINSTNTSQKQEMRDNRSGSA
jgi:hypothetical protein